MAPAPFLVRYLTACRGRVSEYSGALQVSRIFEYARERGSASAPSELLPLLQHGERQWRSVEPVTLPRQQHAAVTGDLCDRTMLHCDEAVWTPKEGLELFDAEQVLRD